MRHEIEDTQNAIVVKNRRVTTTVDGTCIVTTFAIRHDSVISFYRDCRTHDGNSTTTALLGHMTFSTYSPDFSIKICEEREDKDGSPPPTLFDGPPIEGPQVEEENGDDEFSPSSLPVAVQAPGAITGKWGAHTPNGMSGYWSQSPTDPSKLSFYYYSSGWARDPNLRDQTIEDVNAREGNNFRPWHKLPSTGSEHGSSSSPSGSSSEVNQTKTARGRNGWSPRQTGSTASDTAGYTSGPPSNSNPADTSPGTNRRGYP